MTSLLFTQRGRRVRLGANGTTLSALKNKFIGLMISLRCFLFKNLDLTLIYFPLIQVCLVKTCNWLKTTTSNWFSLFLMCVSRLEALCHISNLSLARLENPDTLSQEPFSGIFACNIYGFRRIRGEKTNFALVITYKLIWKLAKFYSLVLKHFASLGKKPEQLCKRA